MKGWPSRSRTAIAAAALAAGCALSTCSARGSAEAPSVHVDVQAPAGWSPGALEPPDVSASPELALASWSAWRPAGDPSKGAPRLVTGCVFVQTSSYTAELEPIALGKIAELAASTALRVAEIGPLRVVASGRDGDIVREAREGDATGPRVTEQSFLAFPRPERGVAGCFALCVAPEGGPPACEASVRSARLAGDLGPPPAEGWGIRALLLAVHHPREAVGLAVALSVLGGFVAVATRRRPRRASSSPRRR